MAKSTPKKRPPAQKKKSANNVALIVVIICIVLIVALIAVYFCMREPVYVYFDLNYQGSTVQRQKVSVTKAVTLPNPTRSGYVFDGWYLDEQCTIKAEETLLVHIFGDTYYAKWIEVGGGSGDVVADGNLSIHFLELGNKYTGDCVYIKAGDVDILIDAGSRKDSASTICDYVNQYCTDGILEYVIVTHAHQDHIAGFVGNSGNGIFANYVCLNIIQFALTDSTSKIYQSYCSERNKEVNESATLYLADDFFDESGNAVNNEFQLTEDISLEILYNYYYFNGASSENDYSVCAMIHQGENNYLFTGDLESAGEEKMVEYYRNIGDPLPHCVLYKAGHHGSKTSSSATLMEAITPEYVCVCCCCGTAEYTDNNPNQFPTQQFVDNVAPYTDAVYVTTIVETYVEKKNWSSSGTVTSMNGNIVFSCIDGVISVHGSNNDLKLKDTDWFKQNRTCPEAWK